MNIVRYVKKQDKNRTLNYCIAFSEEIPHSMKEINKNEQKNLLENHLTAPLISLYPKVNNGRCNVIYERENLLLSIHKTDKQITLEKLEPLHYGINNRMIVTNLQGGK
jgi:alpha-amylase/alpha-mannosidase (GH57 family)